MGIDISTTASKVLVVDKQGKVIATHSSPHTLSTPQPQWSEQDPNEWWQATCHALHHVLNNVNPQDIASIGLTGQMHGLVVLDAQGKVLRPALLWNDQRSYIECEEITEQLGARFLTQHIGSTLLTCFFPPKLKWLQKHEPHVYKNIAHFLLPKDYIRYRLSGAYMTDVADGSGIGLMDIAQRTWSDTLLTALNIPVAWLPDLYESQEVCSAVSLEAEVVTHLLAGTPIVAGAGDQPAGSIGCGIAKVNATNMAVGTSGVIFSVTDHYAPEPLGRLNTFCHAIPKTWFYMGVTLSAAGSMHWLRENLAPNHSYKELDDMAALIAPGSQGLLFTPYLSGERHPHADPLVRASWVGLSLRHQLAHMTRAVMEGVAFSLRDVLEVFYQQGITPKQLMISGGAANSALWRQIIADVTGLPLLTVQANEGAALGAAILAAVGVGAYPTIEAACEHMVAYTEAEYPRANEVERYQHYYVIYCSLYELLRQTCVNLSQLE